MSIQFNSENGDELDFTNVIETGSVNIVMYDFESDNAIFKTLDKEQKQKLIDYLQS